MLAVGFAGDYFFDTRQTLRQRLAARMWFPFARRSCQNRLAPRFCFHFLARRAGLFFYQQFQLQIAQRFAGWPEKPDALLPQPLL